MAGSIKWLAPLQAEAARKIDAGQDAWELDPEAWKYSRITDFLPKSSDPNTDTESTRCDQGQDFTDLQDGEQARCVEALHSIRHPLADINLASLDQGLMIRGVPGDSKRVDLKFDSGHRRLLLHLEPDSQVDLCETIGGAHSLVIHARLERGARLTHRRLGAGNGHAWTLIDAEIREGAHYDLTGIAFGRLRERIECRMNLGGEHARLSTRHLLLGHGRERLDLQLGIDHRAANTHSRHLVKTLAGGASHLTVRGRMHIASNCPGTDAELHIKSLRTSDSARINAKPELEIYTDDVACAHGTSIAELDPEQLFYLASRGIAPRDARAALLKGFARDCLFSDDDLNTAVLARIEALVE